MQPTVALPPFQTLLDDHAAAVAAYLRGMLPSADGEDVLQETYLAALRAYPSFDGAEPRAWLLTIARRKAIDAARASARRPGVGLEAEEVPAPPPADAGALDGEVWAAVAELPAKQREAVLLRFGADLRYREVGRALGCSEAAARRSVHEAITKLRKSKAIEKEAVR